MEKVTTNRTALFYADDGMVASENPVWLQGAFETLTGLFGRVVLWTNVGKAVRIMFCPCRAAGTQLEAAYERLMMGEGLTY